MPERGRRYSLAEVQYNVLSRSEGGAFELYHPFKARDRRIIVIKEAPVHSRKKQRLERARSLSPVRGRQRERERLERPRSPPPERRRRRAPSLEPIRVPSPTRDRTFWDRSIFSVMSPKMPQTTFVPLPPKLEKEKPKDKDKDKDKKDRKDKLSKSAFLWEDESLGSNRSARSSPYYETRSPEDYSPKPKSKKYSNDDKQYEFVLPSLDRRPTSRGGNNDLIHYETREPRSMPDRKLKKVEERSRVFQEKLLDAEDIAQHNLQAAKSEELKRQSAEFEISSLKDQIRKLTLQVDSANERATRAQIEADKARDSQIREARGRLDMLEQRQWREIQDSQKTLPSRPLVRRPTLPVSAYTTVNAAPVNTGQAALDQIRQEYQSRKAEDEPYVVTSGHGRRESRRGRSGDSAWR